MHRDKYFKNKNTYTIYLKIKFSMHFIYACEDCFTHTHSHKHITYAA